MSIILSDNFTRANANPIGGIYLTVNTMNPVQLVSNVAEGTVASSNNGVYDSVNAYPADQFSAVTINAVGGGGSFFCMVRITGGVQSFAYWYYSDNTSGLFNLYSGGVQIVNNYPIGLNTPGAAGDVFKLQVQGQTYSFIRNGAVVNTYYDSTASLTSGSPGFSIFPTATLSQNTLSLFQAGNLANSLAWIT